MPLTGCPPAFSPLNQYFSSSSDTAPSPPSSPSPASRRNTVIHKHTKSLGLLSPIPSLTSLTSSTPRTPKYPSSLSSGTPQGKPKRITSLQVVPNSPTPPQMSLEVRMQQPTPILSGARNVSSSSSTFRPSSRSEMLLRSTLLKDDVMQTSPKAPRSHKRRHSTYSGPSPSVEEEEPFEPLAATLLFRTCSGSSSSCSPRAYAGDSEYSSTKSLSRPTSPAQRLSTPPPTSLSRRPSTARSTTEPTRSPHEQVLRSRLERVLHEDQAETRERTPTPNKRRKRSSSSAAFGWLSWGDDQDSDDMVGFSIHTLPISVLMSETLVSRCTHSVFLKFFAVSLE